MITLEFAVISAFASLAACESDRVLSVSKPETVILIEKNVRALVQEHGHELEYWNGQRWMALAMPTIRFGVHQFEIGRQNLRLRPVHTQSAAARVSTKCSPELSAQQRWFIAAQALAEDTELAHPSDVQILEARKLSMSAPDITTQAFGRHLYAVTLMRAERWLEAETEIIEAAQQWQTLGNHSLESAAFLTAAYFSDRRGAFALSESFAALSTKAASLSNHPYIVLRAKEFDCRAQKRIGQQLGYLRCLENLVRNYKALGEAAEEISLSVDLMLGARELGQRVNAKPVLARLSEINNVPDMALVVGRAHLAAGYVATDQGDLPVALSQFQQALHAFEAALKDSQRWKVNVLIQIANLESSLGLGEQAIAHLNQASALVDPKEAPARIAAVFAAYGNVHVRNDQEAVARTWYLQASTIQSTLAMALDANVSRLFALQSSLNLIPAQPLLNELNALGFLPANYSVRRTILEIHLLTKLHRKDEAIKRFKKIGALQPSPVDAGLIALADFELNSRTKPLVDYLSKLIETADQSPTASLAYLTLRSGEKVRRAWIDSLSASTEPSAVFKTALLATPARFMTSVVSRQKQVEIVAKQAAGEQGFLAQLTGPQERPPERLKAARVPSLAQFQAWLPEGAQALLLLPGGKQSAALWLSRESTKLVILPARATILAASLKLNQALASPQSAPNAAEAAAAALSGLLLAGAPVGAAPKQLWILADELSAAIPFSALPWPGSTVPLVQSTDISLMTGVRVDSTKQQVQAAPGRPTFFAPAYTAAGAGALQSLEFAGLERARIERESSKTWAALTGANATRAAFQDLIQTPGAWLHVAAHGKADPGVLGNAGLWLANSAGPDADFLSWLELGNIRNQAELMVLNACQSATGAQPSRQANVSFALAMSTSGANHVVAALWPVSDVASGTWIPAFYKHLGQTGNAEQSAFALRQAQLSLYRSPHYRHPFYWASLVHFRQVVF